MSETKKREIIKEILGASYRSGHEELFKCPFCDHHKKKFSVNFEKNAAKCWVCGWSAPNLTRIVKRLGSPDQIKVWNTLTGVIEISEYEKIFDFNENSQYLSTEVPLPEEFQSLCNKNSSLTCIKPLNYLLRDRGLTKQDILHWKIGYAASGEYENRIIVPSFNEFGKVNYFVARRYDGKTFLKYKNPNVSKDLVFNELSLDWDSDINIVEGVFDAIKAKNAIPILGSTIKEDSLLFRKIIEKDSAVYIGLDPDAEKKAKKLILDLLKYDAEVYKIPITGKIDIGDMTHEEFLEHKKYAKLIKGQDYFLLDELQRI